MKSGIKLQRRGRAAVLMAPEGKFSYFHPEYLFTGLGWDAQTASLLLVRHEVKSLLILGLGGGTVARQCRGLFPEAEIVGVEIDPAVVRLARRHFGLDDLAVRTVVAPGQLFIRDTCESFDAIIDDMWSPGAARDKPIFKEPDWAGLVRARLRPGGMYAVNLYSRAEDSYEAATAVRLLRGHFAQMCEVSPSPGQTCVVAAGCGLHSPNDARARLRRLPTPLADGLRHVRFRALHGRAQEC